MSKKNKRVFHRLFLFTCDFFLLTFLLLSGFACNSDSSTRSYEEKSQKQIPPVSARTAAIEKSSAPGRWRWQTPAGWRQMPATGMRLAAFVLATGGGKIECTIISLPGDGGGLQANADRWRRQLGLPLFSQAAYDSFLARQKKFSTFQGFSGVMFDFTGHSADRRLENRESLMVGIIDADGETIFVKMNGGEKSLAANREALLSLCRSLEKGS